jgi:hypothetical protein
MLQQTREEKQHLIILIDSEYRTYKYKIIEIEAYYIGG